MRISMASQNFYFNLDVKKHHCFFHTINEVSITAREHFECQLPNLACWTIEIQKGIQGPRSPSLGIRHYMNKDNFNNDIADFTNKGSSMCIIWDGVVNFICLCEWKWNKWGFMFMQLSITKGCKHNVVAKGCKHNVVAGEGGDGCHLRVVPPGQLLRRPSTPRQTYFQGFMDLCFLFVNFFSCVDCFLVC